jgi:hypothetical protein
VPLSLILTTEKAKQSDIGKALAAHNCKPRSSHSWLASMLLQERAKNESSFWCVCCCEKNHLSPICSRRFCFRYPYLAILPATYSHMPIHYDEEEIEELSGSIAYAKVFAQAEDLVLEYENLCTCYPEYAQRFSRDDLVWYWSASGFMCVNKWVSASQSVACFVFIGLAWPCSRASSALMSMAQPTMGWCRTLIC